MHFRLTFHIPLLALNPQEAPTFTLRQETGPVTIELKCSGGYILDWQCVAICETEPKERIKAIFSGLHDGSLNPRDEWEQEFGLRTLELLGPPPYRAFIDELERGLADASRRCVSVLQWRMGMPGRHQPLQRVNRLWWSLNATEWQAIPGIAGAEATAVFPYRNLGEVLHKEITEMVQMGADEPLGHELLREAIEGRRTGERSAFVVAVMAAEVGLKQCIAELLPQTEWLIQNIQSPPVPKLLTNLLPNVPAKCTFDGRVLPPPKSVRSTIRTAIEMRNAVVHKGGHPKVGEELESVIEAVRDLLYLLDYYRGHSWALQLMRPDVRKELDKAAKSG